MRAIDTFESLIQKVHEMSANYYDETIEVKDIEFESLYTAWIGGNRFTVLPSAQRLLANKLRVPYSYLCRCPGELQAKNLNYWIRREAEKRDTFFCRFDGAKLRAVFTSRYTAIDNMEILSKMLESGFSPNREVHYSIDDELLIMKVPDYSRSFEIEADDRIVPGISIANSEVGILAFTIEAYFYRLVCSNGLISMTSVQSKFKHISRKALTQFPSLLDGIVKESRITQEKFTISIESRVEDPISTIRSFAKQFHINRKELETVEHAWEFDPGYTMWHVVNAFTSAAREPSLTAEQAYKLEKVGGMILSIIKT